MARKPSKLLTIDSLAAHFHQPLHQAANELAVSTTLLKRTCRKLGIKKWPYRQFNSMQKRILTLESSEEGKKMPDSLRKHLIQCIRKKEEKLKQQILKPRTTTTTRNCSLDQNTNNNLIESDFDDYYISSSSFSSPISSDEEKYDNYKEKQYYEMDRHIFSEKEQTFNDSAGRQVETSINGSFPLSLSGVGNPRQMTDNDVAFRSSAVTLETTSMLHQPMQSKINHSNVSRTPNVQHERTSPFSVRSETEKTGMESRKGQFLLPQEDSHFFTSTNPLPKDPKSFDEKVIHPQKKAQLSYILL